jgi:hypothetical protein
MLSEPAYIQYPVPTHKPLPGSFSVARFINEKKRGQPVNQKKNPRSQSLENLPIAQLDVVQRRDLRGLVDDRMKVISKAYEFHVSQDWALNMDLNLQGELEKAQLALLESQENSVKKMSKGLYGRLLGQMKLMFDKSMERFIAEKEKPSKKNVEDFVSSEEISEFYKYKFDSVSKEIGENFSEIIINRLKSDMNELQNGLFREIAAHIGEEFSKLSKLSFA